ncbi:unnamed protein product [Rhizophagus irregularis]|nr:unnamed protein product [Rhizophagus irregularis]
MKFPHILHENESTIAHQHPISRKILEFPIEETRTQNLNPYTAKNKFEDTMIRYIGKVLMDFINKIIDIPGHRPLQIKYCSTGLNTTSRTSFTENNSSNKGRMKADIVGIREKNKRSLTIKGSEIALHSDLFF